MSFFGQQNNNQPQQGAGFGGFGTNNNNNAPGFGQPQNTGFGGAANTSGSIFGGANSGFGSGAGGFGSGNTTTTPFGTSRPGFGTNTTSSGSMFGGTTATAGASTGFGGFGSTSNNTSGGLFGGASKPAFGTGTTSGGGLFGSGSGGNTFGTSNTQSTGAFGAPLSSALGANVAESQGTAVTPFQAYSEKESGTNVSNQFQSIPFMQPYKNYSFEELRLADYNQGRRYGNSGGQAGAFGVTTGFGGFGQQNNTGGFGSAGAGSGGGVFGSTSTASPFGGTQTAGASFGGAGTGTSLFGTGAAKPTAGIFGGTNTAAAQPSGGIFGAAGQTGFGTASTTGFGTGNTGGGGIFGGGTQQQAPKSNFSFGTQNSSSPFGTGAAGATNSGNSIFGGNQTTTAFGSSQQQPQTAASNPFGNFGTNQPQAQTGVSSTFGGFGTANQQTQKPGLFGTPAASSDGGSGLFGNTQQNNQQPSTGGIFGTNTNTQPGTSLFGPKTTLTGQGLFGQPPNTTNNGGTGLFPGSAFTINNNNQNQPNQGGGPFGVSNQQQQQQKPGGLFGTSTATTGGLFPSTNNQQLSGGSIFGNLGSNNQAQTPSLFGASANTGSSSLYNTPQQQQNALQPPQAQFASLGQNPYGNSSIFWGLPPVQQTGPIATPISTAQKLKKSAVLPQYKINPNQASRLVTPQKHGFGFSYSTYGSPSSVSSNQSTPGGLSSSLLYGSIGRGLGKSLSTSNLRRTFDSDGDSILSPGAFSAGSSRLSGAGNLKRLTIDRNLRTDLFGQQGPAAITSPDKVDQSRQPGILKKKVSFDASTVGGNGTGQNGVELNGANGFLVEDINDCATPSAQEQGFLRSSTRANSRLMTSKSNGTLLESEMEQVKGNELAIVHEDASPESLPNATIRSFVPIPQTDPKPQAYNMYPPREELDKLTTEELKHLSGFSVGREACGHVTFDEPVDLTLTPLDDLYGKIVLIELRSITVYPDSHKKPPVGQGLNVPSTIYLENSWPRQKDRKTPSHEKSGPRFNRHVDRLRKVGDTEFVRYEKDTGTWVFKVPHFTTYALDFDETGSEGDSLLTSTMSVAPDTPTPKSRATREEYTSQPIDSTQQPSFLSDEQYLSSSSPDDTFEFRRKKVLPGTFNDTFPFETEFEMEDTSHDNESFSNEQLGASPSESGSDEPSELQDIDENAEDRSSIVQDDDMDMAGAFPQGDLEDATLTPNGGLPGPKSILKVTYQGQGGYGTPLKLRFNPSGDWPEELQRTISPRKQDRQALRDNQAHVLEDQEVHHEPTPKITSQLNGAANSLSTSIDLMNSLFGQEKARTSGRTVDQAAKEKGLKWPYSRKSKTSGGEEDNMSETERTFHESYKPRWGPQSTLLYAMSSKLNFSQSNHNPKNSLLNDQKGTFVSEGKDIRFAKFAINSPLIPETLVKQRTYTRIAVKKGVPFAEVHRIPFRELAETVSKADREYAVWELATILFDENRPDFTKLDSSIDTVAFSHRVRKDELTSMWQKLCLSTALKAVANAPNAEERAIAQLSANNVVEACDELLQGKDYRLAILTAQIGGDRIMREDIASQINEWRDLKVLSEMTEPIRALYELLAGNTCVCEGTKGPLEDRAITFVISEHFGMDWKRAFGLRLWYGIQAEEPIEAAVKKYTDDLEKDERIKPLPWFLEERTRGQWTDPHADLREDIFWGFLKLYAASQNSFPHQSISSIVAPHNSTGNPLDSRLSFQLYHTLSLLFPTASDTSKGDQLALDFSIHLDSAGEWLWAVFILLHLSDHLQRQNSVQSLLALHAVDFNDDDHPTFKTLIHEFLIPAAWIWEAKALYERSVTQDHDREVRFLLQARNWDEAHKTLCREVAPRAVIERQYAGLNDLLNLFGEGREHVGDWGLGGGVYEDFITLVLNDAERKKPEAGKLAVLNRLLDGLPGMVQERTGCLALEETVAVREMSAVVARAVADLAGTTAKGIEPWRILHLPLPEEGYLTHTLELGLGYYEALMASG